MRLLLVSVLIAASGALPLATRAADGDAAPGAFYAELGGQEGIRHFTHTLIGLITSDPRIKDKFEDADMDRLEGLLAEQFCDLSGGPCHYSGHDMKAAHAHHDITTAQFNALAEDLQIAMEQDHVPSAAANKLIAKLAPMQRDVVTK